MKLITTVLLTISMQFLFAQPAFFTPQNATNAVSFLNSSTYSISTVNIYNVSNYLLNAPLEFTNGANLNSLQFNLPMPNGTNVLFNVVESPIMEAGLQAKYPSFKTYKGRSANIKGYKMRLSLTSLGFHAMVFTPNGTVIIDPLLSNKNNVISYYKKDYNASQVPSNYCGVGPALTGKPTLTPFQIKQKSANKAAAVSNGTMLRTYRLACAATAEYTASHGSGSVADGQAAIVVAINRVTGVYESELAIRMVLVSNNNSIVYTNSLTDPYTNSNGVIMLTENQNNLDNVIGTANYDIGHVFSTGGGGVAQLNSPCSNGNKAKGVTGLPNPVGDPFYIDFVAHEIGHQFGSNHTFNGSTGSCAGTNRNASTAYEPGSGTTIMAYAGICSPQNIQNNSDAYFHGSSYDEIVAFTTVNGGNTCPVKTTTNNTPPTVNAGSDYTIPKNTPFEITGSATDTDATASLTYCWEEYDLGAAGAPDQANSNVPIFRSFTPSASPTRIFPQISDIVNGTQTTGEILPNIARVMNFRLTARDNQSNGGGVDFDAMQVTIDGASGPFVVTAPNTNVTWAGGSTQTITWNVANTASSPISATTVDVYLSADGGFTYPTVIATGLTNNGSASITVPSIATSQARIKVKASGNIFFDISDQDFTITAPPFVAPSNLVATSVSSSQINLSWADNSNNETGFEIDRSPNNTSNFTLLTTLATNAVNYSDNGLTSNSIYYYRVRAVNATTNTSYSNNDSAKTFDVPPSAPTTLVATSSSSSQIDLVWADNSSNESGFQLERAPVNTTNFTLLQLLAANSTSYSNTGLTSNTTYKYRVRAINATGNSAYSNTDSATTNDVIPTTPSSLVATANSSTTVQVSWTDNSNNESNFLLERSLTNTSNFALIATLSANTITYNDAALTANTIYYYRVRASNAIGNSAYSNSDSALTQMTPVVAPNSPSTLVATAAGVSQINLQWVDNSNNESGFEIQRSINTNGTYTLLTTVSADEIIYSDTALNSSTTYYYKVRAVNAAGNSAYSNEDSAKTANIPVGVLEGILNNTIRIYPNPGAQFNVEFDNDLIGTIELNISNNLGQTILKESLVKQTTFVNYKMNLTNRAKGLYFLQVSYNGALKTYKLLNE